MHRLLALVFVVGCGGSARAPATPSPAPELLPEPVTVATTDPCDGGETRADPCAGGEAPQQVAIADPCDGGEATGGLGMRGTGEGGGGTGKGGGGTGTGELDGLGSVGTIGSGSGSGRGYGAGGGAPGSGNPIGQRERRHMVRFKFGTPTITGALPAAVVRRVAHRHQNQLRFCYERVLAKDPALAGTVTLDLVVTTEGSVSQAKATGMTAEVNDCIMGSAMRWSFPRPAKGIVKITLPMTFAPPKGT